MNNKSLLGILIALAFIGCTQNEKKIEKITTVDEWELVYKNDRNGNKVFGDKAKLISYVRKGNPIKIGWASRRQNDTTKTVEHIVDAEFLTIANGSQVFAQIKPFLAQRPDLTSDTLSMTLLPVQSNWVLGTNGMINSLNINLSTDSVQTYKPKPFGLGLSWFSKISSPRKKNLYGTKFKLEKNEYTSEKKYESKITRIHAFINGSFVMWHGI